jgi:hypothetical protein
MHHAAKVYFGAENSTQHKMIEMHIASKRVCYVPVVIKRHRRALGYCYIEPYKKLLQFKCRATHSP